jgi:hypothetical protein
MGEYAHPPRLRFAAALRGVYGFGMSTLSELEGVVDRLSVAEQEELLRHLEARLHRHGAMPGRTPHDDWMRRLDSLRASIDSGSSNLSGERVLAELREE